MPYMYMTTGIYVRLILMTYFVAENVATLRSSACSGRTLMAGTARQMVLFASNNVYTSSSDDDEDDDDFSSLSDIALSSSVE